MRRLVTPRCALAALLALAVLAGAPIARAQSSSELAEARRLFEAGLAAASEHRWDEARAQFEASLAITERASTLLNLAAAQAETGAAVASAASYRRFLEIATGRDARHRADAEAALARVEGRIAHLTLDTSRLEGGDSVEIDDRTLLPATLAESIPLDPGMHRVAVVRDGGVIFEESLTLGEGQRRALTIDVGGRRTAAPVEPVVAASGGDAPADDPGHGSDDGLWIGLGVTAGVLVVAGIVVGVLVATTPQGEPLYAGNVGDGMIRF